MRKNNASKRRGAAELSDSSHGRSTPAAAETSGAAAGTESVPGRYDRTGTTSPGIGQGVDVAEVTLPVVEEQMTIEKRKIEKGRVVVHIEPRVEEQVVDVPLVAEHVEVERVPVNRYIDAPLPVREEGDVTIVPVFEEVLVVEKRLMLKEELRITRRRVSTSEQRRVEVRKEEVHVRRTESSGEEPAADGTGVAKPA